MPTQLQIRDAIKAKMLTVGGVGVVHTFERYAPNLATLKTQYVTGNQLLGWFIRLQRTQRASEMSGRIAILHTWLIRGFMALDDAMSTELTFDALVESLQNAFAADETLGGLIGQSVTEDGAVAGLQRDKAGPVMFCGVLCHSADLRLPTLHHE